jgi:hypothetical protein
MHTHGALYERDCAREAGKVFLLPTKNVNKLLCTYVTLHKNTTQMLLKNEKRGSIFQSG